MDVRQLRYFLAVVESGSVSGASAKLGISQPSVGQQVRNLEEEIGTALLFRYSRGVRVTGTGELLVQLARDIIDRVDTASRILQEHSTEPRGELRLGLTMSSVVPLAAPLVRTTLSLYPRIELSIREALSPHLTELLDQEHLDLALTYSSDLPETVRSEPLIEEDFYFCVHPGHARAACTDIRFDDMLHEDLFLPPRSHLLTTQLEVEAKRLGGQVRARATVQSIGILLQLVEEGTGATILPFSAVARQVSEGRLAALLIVEPTLPRVMTLAYTARRPMTRTERAVRDVIQAEVQGLLAHGRYRWRDPARAP